MTRYKAVVFDKDGTLADFHATYDEATGKVLEKICGDNPELLKRAAVAVNFDLENREIEPGSVIVAGSGIDIAKALQPVLGFDDCTAQGAMLDALYGEICKQTVQFLPGVHKVLETMHSKGILLGIATNDAEANARSQVDTLGALNFFSDVFGADSGFGAKPGPGMVNAFLSSCGLDKHHVMMVGDSTHDMQAGKAAGLVTCAVLSGPATCTELAPHADVILQSVADLPEYLASTLILS